MSFTLLRNHGIFAKSLCITMNLTYRCIVSFVTMIIFEFLGPAVGQKPIKFILPELMSYLGERGVLCVGNG